MWLKIYLVFLLAKKAQAYSLRPQVIIIDDRRYLDPKDEFVAQKIFQDENLLLKFINSALRPNSNDSQQLCSSMQLMGNIRTPDIFGKQTIVDVVCHSNTTGDQTIVEIQVAREKHFLNTAQFYVSRLINEQRPNFTRQRLHLDDHYAKLKPVHFIGILDFEISPDDDFISTHLTLNNKTKRHQLTLPTYTFIELPKLSRGKSFHVDKYETFVEKLSYFFWFEWSEQKYKDGLKKLMSSDPDIQRAVNYANPGTWTITDKNVFQRIIDNRDVLASRLCAVYDDGLRLGRRLGREEKFLIQMMRRSNLSDEKIANIAKKSVQEIARLRSTLDCDKQSESDDY
ncbi:uncharacterized protein LOC135839009 [Planococcus citri]|uniref:uncharacterized protein LOC135839009 n=1 Tax=Planococcus citri TaxID=170843 RepID=UPI0031F80C96